MFFYSWPLASSVTGVTPVNSTDIATSGVYNITVTCIIHPDNTADQCVVMAVADDGVTRTGEICNEYKFIFNLFNRH